MRAGESAWSRSRGLLFPLLIVTSVLVILAPLPPVLMDLMIAANITAAVLILLTTIYVSRPLDFSVFPAILLGTTLVRLVLNVASTRLILTQGGTSQTAAAGDVIQAFGQFVAGDKVVVGLVIFVILIVIQFMVVTKGAGRISEVSARFFLDGLPGRQMSIDADLANKLISEQEAQHRRAELERQADFYGAMDGASKFVRGDALAGIVITLINIVGGLYVGIFEAGMSPQQAGTVFTKLTIGDGLVSQIPSFLIAIAAGLIVTRSSQASNLSTDVVTQMFRHPQAMFLAAGFLAAMSVTGLPALPMICLSAACGFVGYLLLKNPPADEVQLASTSYETEHAVEQNAPPNSATNRPEDLIAVELLTIELGSGAVSLADKTTGGDLLERVGHVRSQIASELGIILPQVHIRDNSWLGSNDYVIRLRGAEVARGDVWATHRIAVNRGAARGQLPGIRTTSPIDGHDAFWIEPQATDRAESQGFSVLEASGLIAQHLAEVCRHQACELLTRQHVHELVGALRDRAPLLIEECESSGYRISVLHQVMKQLLAERVPIRDLEAILQTVIDHSENNSAHQLTEKVRTALARNISQKLRDYKRRIHVVTLSTDLEKEFVTALRTGDADRTRSMQDAIVVAVQAEIRNLTSIGLPPILVTNSSEIRGKLFEWCQRTIPRLHAVKIAEITTDTEIVTRGHIGLESIVAIR